MRLLSTALCAMAIVGAPVAAQAASTYYVNAEAFATAAGTTSLEAFEGAFPANTSVFSTADVTVSCPTQDCLTQVLSDYPDGMYAIGSYEAVTFLFATPVRAFGIDVLGFATAGILADLRLQVGSADPVTLYANQFRPLPLFAGVVSDTAFSQVTLSGTDIADFIAYDSLRYGPGLHQTISSAPEPSAWALMILGVGGAGVVLRRRRAALAAG